MANEAGQSNPQRSDTLTPGGEPPNPFLDWLAGPGSLLHGITTFNLADRLGIGQGNNGITAVPELETPVVPDVLKAAVDQLGQYWADGTVTQQQHDVFNSLLANAKNQGEVQDILGQMQAAAREGESRQTAERGRQEIFGGTNRLADTYRPQMQQELDRFNNLLNNPNQIRSDSQLGDVIANAEETINQDVLRGREQLRRTQASRGVSSSGKAQGLARGLEERASASRAGLFDTMQNSIRGLRDTASDRLQGFDQDIINARAGAEAGRFDQGLNLLGRGADYFSPLGTRLDTESLRLGAESSNLGTLLNTIFGAAALGQDSMNQGMQFFQALPGMFRGK